MAITVVPFTSTHLATAARYVVVFNAAPWHDHWTPATARRRLADTLATPGALGFVLRVDHLLGFVLGSGEPWFDGTHCSLKALCIRVDRQRCGLGTLLLRHLDQARQERHVDRVYLLTAGMADPPGGAGADQFVVSLTHCQGWGQPCSLLKNPSGCE